MILFKFKNEDAYKDAMDWCSWATHRNCMSLKRWKQGMMINDIQFHMIQFWIQIHGLEVEKFSKQNAEKICERIGTVIEVGDILGPMGIDRDYLRIKVEIDTMKQLLASFWYTRRNGSVGRVEGMSAYQNSVSDVAKLDILRGYVNLK